MCIWLQFCCLCSFCRARKETKHWSVGKTAQRGQDVLLHYLLRQTHDSLYGLTHRKWVYCTSSFSLINIKHIDSMITSFYLSWSQSFWCDSFRRRRNFRHIDDDNKKHRSLKPNFLRSPPPSSFGSPSGGETSRWCGEVVLWPTSAFYHCPPNPGQHLLNSKPSSPLPMAEGYAVGRGVSQWQSAGPPCSKLWVPSQALRKTRGVF